MGTTSKLCCGQQGEWENELVLQAAQGGGCPRCFTVLQVTAAGSHLTPRGMLRLLYLPTPSFRLFVAVKCLTITIPLISSLKIETLTTKCYSFAYVVVKTSLN